MKTVTRVFRLGRLGPLLALLAAALLLAVAAAPGAHAAGSLDDAANALRHGPVYVDPRAHDQLPRSDAGDLAHKIKQADKPVFVAVLPAHAGFHQSTVLKDLRGEVGLGGVYAVLLGNHLGAGSDSVVMSHSSVNDLRGAVQRSDAGNPKAMLDDFVDQAVQQANGQAPAEWSNGSSGADTRTGGGALLVTLAALVVVSASGAFLVSKRSNKLREQQERARLEELRPVVDEDITAFGEELTRIGFEPTAPHADDAMREDYGRALDSYEKAKSTMGRARGPDDVRRVSEALEQGRFSLATLEARLAGRPLPERRPPCFFDPRHGPSVVDVRWTPPGVEASDASDASEARTIPVCAADATRLADGEEPMAREVPTPDGRRPYWDAGPAYAPWAFGYFGGGLLPGMLMGTMLGSMLGGPYAYGAGFDGGGFDGDWSGGDVDGGFGDGGFGGGFGGGGFDGGGGFGGGF